MDWKIIFTSFVFIQAETTIKMTISVRMAMDMNATNIIDQGSFGHNFL
jgi:hypothetical protein